MKNFLLVIILIALLIGSFCIISYQTIYKVAVKADEKTNDMFAFEQSVEGMRDKVQGMVAEGYSEPDEETRDKKKQPDKQGIISRLLNLFKR
jgi:hypothetical protein